MSKNISTLIQWVVRRHKLFQSSNGATFILQVKKENATIGCHVQAFACTFKFGFSFLNGLAGSWGYGKDHSFVKLLLESIDRQWYGNKKEQI